MLGQFIVLSLAMIIDAPAMALSVRSVSTGDKSACAVVENKVKCWGSNASGQLGNGWTGTTESTPVSVATNTSTIPGTSHCVYWGPFCWYVVQDTPTIPASALAGKSVTKVTVGSNHACAIANAGVYCWGDNTYGQLGNRTNTSSAVPVTVDTLATNSPTKSALGGKEVIDIAAGEYFTCALASDGSIACWGMGANGRLGTGNMNNANYPQTVAGALVGKRGIKLAKVAGGAMCAIAIGSAESASSTSGRPYCWGYGMGDVGSLATQYLGCNANTPTTQRAPYLIATDYVHTATPRDSSGVASVLSNIDIAVSNDITGTSNGKAYYWGLHGYNTYRSVGPASCTIQECKMVFLQQTPTRLRLASYHSDSGDGVNATLVNKVTGSGPNAGTHKPNPGSTGSSTPGWNPNKRRVCTNVNHYGLYNSFAEVGSTTTVGPLYTSGPLNGTISNASGNAYDGLFCGQTGSNVIYCDAHATDKTNGQLGLTLAQAGAANWSSVTGPKQVYAAGWLSGKTVTDLGTGSSGFTCATVSGGVGCWGLNSSGQLGNGNTTSQFNATAVNF